MARLDRLPAVNVAQLGRCWAASFPMTCCTPSRRWTRPPCRRGWRSWWTTELLYQRGRPPRATYIFKHALIQDAAYASLLRSTRQQYHQRMAHVLAARFPETVEAQPELLAHHYTEAALTEDAVNFWHKAGQQASARSAYVEALVHLRQGLEMLQALPETAVSAQQELVLQLTLGESLEASQGYTAPEVAQAYTRVRELCQHVDESPQLFPILVALRRFYTFRGEMQTAQELAEQLLHLAQRQPDGARSCRRRIGRWDRPCTFVASLCLPARTWSRVSPAIPPGRSAPRPTVMRPAPRLPVSSLPPRIYGRSAMRTRHSRAPMRVCVWRTSWHTPSPS